MTDFYQRTDGDYVIKVQDGVIKLTRQELTELRQQIRDVLSDVLREQRKTR